MIWFLTFGKNGSAGMPAVPATILMSDPEIARDSPRWPEMAQDSPR